MTTPVTPTPAPAAATSRLARLALVLRRHAPILLLTLWAGVLYFHDLGGRSLWYDEAWVANSALSPHLADAFVSEDAPQSTPPLFLTGLWLIARVASSEAALRLLPAVCALLAVPLFYALGRRLFGRDGLALAGAGLLAFAPASLNYARQLKQYTGDVLAVVVLFLLAERYCASRRRGDLVALAAAAAVAVWFSTVSIVAVLALLVRLLVAALGDAGEGAAPRRMTARLRAWALPIAVVALAAGLSFVVEYAAVLQGPANDSYLRAFWRSQFLKGSSLPESAALAVQRTRDLSAFLARYHPGLGLALFVLYAAGSLLALVRRRWAVAVYALAPLLVVATLAYLERYPYGDNRTDLFLLPGFCLAAGAALACVWPKTPRRELIAVTLVALGAFWLGERATELHVKRPYRREELREPLAAMQALRQPGDYVYVYYGARPAFRYYARGRWDSRTVIGTESRGAPEGYEQELRRLFERSEQPSRWWVVLSHFGPREDERNLIIQTFREHCRRSERFTAYGAEVALFSCSQEVGE